MAFVILRVSNYWYVLRSTEAIASRPWSFSEWKLIEHVRTNLEVPVTHSCH